MRERTPLIAVTILWSAGLVLSGWRPFDRATWWMEVAPVLIVLPALWLIGRRHPLTPLLLALIALHGCVLMLGGAYSYARVPAGFAVQEWLGLARNPYDRLGHFMQGFVPAIAFREMFVHGGVVARRFLAPIIVACCLAVSAAYELIEFAAALALGQGADAFLGTQGDPWDTQWDMAMCLAGAALALVTCARLHDRQLQNRAASVSP